MGYFVVPNEFIPELSTVINFIMSFTPLLSYGSTVLSIRKKRSSQGFSIDICATMLIASILRIGYYFNDPFEMALLRQCFVMVFIQTILLHTALKYRSLDEVTFEEYENDWKSHFELFKETNKGHLNELMDQMDEIDTLDIQLWGKFICSGFIKFIYNNFIIIGGVILQIVKDIVRLFDHHYIRPFKFWQWSNAITYWKFLGGFIITLTIIQLIFNGAEHLGVILGSMSFLVESSLPLPQIMLFQRVKNVDNFKTILLLSWLGGDVTKISYLFFGTNNVGLLFIIAAFFQMSLNLVITYQFFYYMMHPTYNYDSSLESSQSFELPLRGNPRSRTSSIDVGSGIDSGLGLRGGINQYGNSIPHRNSILPSRSISSVISVGSEIPLVPQHQHFLDEKGTIEGSSINGIETDLSDLPSNTLNFESGKRISVDLGHGVVEEFRSRGNTFK